MTAGTETRHSDSNHSGAPANGATKVGLLRCNWREHEIEIAVADVACGVVCSLDR